MNAFVVTLGVLLAAGQVSAAQTLQRQGNQLLQGGRLNEARDAFEKLLNAEPQNVEAQQGEVAASEKLALTARAASQMAVALQALLRARRFVPGDTRLLYDLGILEDEMRLYQDADRTLAALEELHPSDPQALYAAARVKLDLGQLDAAQSRMQAYLKLRDDDASAHYGLGRVYQLESHYDLAEVEFRRAIELQPVQTEAYYELGDMALLQGNVEEAIAQFGRTLARDPKHGGALAGMGQALFKQKDYKQAETYLQRAIAVAPAYQSGHYYLGLTLARLGRTEDSQRELALATKLADETSRKERERLQLNPEDGKP